MAVASMVIGILAILGFDLIGAFIVAIICGHIALSQIKASNGRLGGRGMAIAGLILGYLPVVIILGFFLILFLIGISLRSI